MRMPTHGRSSVKWPPVEAGSAVCLYSWERTSTWATVLGRQTTAEPERLRGADLSWLSSLHLHEDEGLHSSWRTTAFLCGNKGHICDSSSVTQQVQLFLHMLHKCLGGFAFWYVDTLKVKLKIFWEDIAYFCIIVLWCIYWTVIRCEI